MRINRYVALCSGLSRRAADAAIATGRVTVDGQPPSPGQDVLPNAQVRLDHRPLRPPQTTQTILFNKPAGYVVSRNGQGSKTIYHLLPSALHHLKPIGRLDKESSGLLLLTSDGALAQQLTHPRFQKQKVYEITLDKPLTSHHHNLVTTRGVALPDGLSKLGLTPLKDENRKHWRVTMHEGRNRQIRRTFEALGYNVAYLHRTQFGPYHLATLPSGHHQTITTRS